MKICFFCEFCSYEAGGPLSTITWESGSISCDKGHWLTYGNNDLVDIGIKLATAEKCDDYKPAKGVPADHG